MYVHGEHDVNKSNANSIGCVTPWNERDELRSENPIMRNLSRSPKYTLIEKILGEAKPETEKE